MYASVNLLPASLRQARARARRWRAWTGVLSALVAITACGGGALAIAHGAIAGLERRVDDALRRTTQVDQQLSARLERRAALLDRLKLFAGAHRPQPWPAWWASLEAAAGEEVLLTEVSSKSEPVVPEPATRAPAKTPGAAAPPPRKPPPRTVQVRGAALDHEKLLAMVNRLQASPEWRDVSLVRATRQPVGGVPAVVFELACLAAEDPR